MATIELTKENFNETIENNDVVVVDFWVPWCGPCRMFAPTFEVVSEQYPNVVFAKLNTEDQQELAASFNIRSIPTLMVVREKVVIFTQAGMLPGFPTGPVLLEKMKAAASDFGPRWSAE